jgi:hypothetical protein
VAGEGLYRPELFEPLTDRRWDEAIVRDAVSSIVEGVERAFRGPDDLWPRDPTPAEPGWNLPDALTSLYEGAAGTLSALGDLQQRGLAETRLDLGQLAGQILERYEATPDFGRSTVHLPEPRDAALLTGETGVLLTAMRLAPTPALADRLDARILTNVDNEADEVMWGTPGSLMAATVMLRRTGDDRWAAAASVSREAVLRRRHLDGLWAQHLDGDELQRLDPIHGTSGVVLALLASLDGPDRGALERDALELFRRLAVFEDGLANWPVQVGERPSLLRWCAGAPGIVFATAGYLDADLLEAAAALIWRAGPPRMSTGPGICCGTSGNGYALLKVFERTGDERWLERARSFAMHALEQVERDQLRSGARWHSLWKGDPGVARYAADCLVGQARYPVFDDVRALSLATGRAGPH